MTNVRVPFARRTLWSQTAVPGPSNEPLTTDSKADVAIVVGGFTSLTAAIHLEEAGVRVAVLEAEEVGDGASG